MIKVGITGGIGSGKTIICKIFDNLGVPIYNADYEAKIIMNTDNIIKAELSKAFGKNIYDSSGKINKHKLTSIIFNDSNKVKLINSIVHPLVIKNYNNWLLYNKYQKYTVLESAILFESGYNNLMDFIITVYAPENLKIDRTMFRDNCDKSVVIKKMENQLNDDFKAQKSNFIIYNDNKQLVIPQILEIHNKIISSIVSN